MNQQAPLSIDSLDTWLNYWSHVHVTGIDLGLERVIPVAEKLGVTQPNAKVFTVAGTNGKELNHNHTGCDIKRTGL